MKAATLGFEEVGPDQVILVDGEGRLLAGEGRAHAEYPIHTEIMAARPELGAVVHSHAPHAVALAASGEPLRPISHEGTLFVPPAVARFEETGDLILTKELGAKVAGAIGSRNALFLVNHGIVTVGGDVPIAVMTALLLERACRMQILASSAGGARHWSSDEEALSKREHCYSEPLLRQAWDYLVRRLA